MLNACRVDASLSVRYTVLYKISFRQDVMAGGRGRGKDRRGGVAFGCSEKLLSPLHNTVPPIGYFEILTTFYASHQLNNTSPALVSSRLSIALLVHYIVEFSTKSTISKSLWKRNEITIYCPDNNLY